MRVQTNLVGEIVDLESVIISLSHGRQLWGAVIVLTLAVTTKPTPTKVNVVIEFR